MQPHTVRDSSNTRVTGPWTGRLDQKIRKNPEQQTGKTILSTKPSLKLVWYPFMFFLFVLTLNEEDNLLFSIYDTQSFKITLRFQSSLLKPRGGNIHKLTNIKR